jgi:hypothetical protein
VIILNREKVSFLNKRSESSIKGLVEHLSDGFANLEVSIIIVGGVLDDLHKFPVVTNEEACNSGHKLSVGLGIEGGEAGELLAEEGEIAVTIKWLFTNDKSTRRREWFSR